LGNAVVGRSCQTQQMLEQETMQANGLAMDLQQRRLLLKYRGLLLDDRLQQAGDLWRRWRAHAPLADHSSAGCSSMATVRALSCEALPPRMMTSSTKELGARGFFLRQPPARD
jgi:hypothetical protein